MKMRLFEKILTLMFDALAISVAFWSTFHIRYKSGWFPETFDPTRDFSGYTTPLVIFTVLWLLLFFFGGLYREWYKESRIDEALVVMRTILIGMFMLFLVISADELVAFVKTGAAPALFSRTQFATFSVYGICMIFFATANRLVMHTILGWLFSRGIGVANMLIIGANTDGETLMKEIRRYPHLGYNVVGFIDDDGRKRGTECSGLPVFGTYSDLQNVARKQRVSSLIISQVSSSPNEILRILDFCGEIQFTVYMVPSLVDVISGHLKTHQLFGVPLLVLLQDHMPPWEAQIKRIMDIAVSATFLLVFSWLYGLVALAVKLSSPGPAIYRQIRAGQNGKPFTIYKFRSMYQDAESRTGPQWASKNDPRITPTGRIIRKTRLDEIPQLFNVLKGEMSLVGPRPERPFFIEQLRKEIPWYVRRIRMKPGITGWAQVKHKYDETIEDVRQKVLYDLYYFENMSIMLDIKILLRTVIVALTGKGAN